MSAHEVLLDIRSLEEDLLAFERKYGLRSETFLRCFAGCSISASGVQADRQAFDIAVLDT